MKYYLTLSAFIFLSCQSQEELAFGAFEDKEYEVALKHFQEVSKMDPHNWYHLFNVARCLEELARYDDAVVWYGKSLKYKPDAEEVLLARGRCLLKTEYLPGAYTDISRILDKNPGHFDANYLMGRIAMADNDPWIALNYYNKAIVINDKEVNLYYHRAIAMGTVGNTYGAIRDLNHVLSQNSSFNQAYYNRGILLMRNERFSDAISDFDVAEELNYAPAELYVRRADCKNMLGFANEACKDYKKAADKDKSYSRVLAEMCVAAK